MISVILSRNEENVLKKYDTLDELYNDFNNADKVNSEGLIFIIDTLPFWYMVETLNDNGKLIRREFKKFKEFDKSYRQ